MFSMRGNYWNFHFFLSPFSTHISFYEDTLKNVYAMIVQDSNNVIGCILAALTEIRSILHNKNGSQ
jgi:hypothetical protein